jgi:hypothetical protein
LMN